MHRLLTVTLACLGMVGALAIDTYLPSIPAIGREFNVGPLAVQQTLCKQLDELRRLKPDKLVRRRREKFMRMGQFLE